MWIQNFGVCGEITCIGLESREVAVGESSVDRGEVEKISKALADQTRLMIFEAIAAQPEMTCGEIVSQRGLTPATISHHLKVLHDAGLIACRREGQFVHSSTVPKTMKAYATALQKMARAVNNNSPRSAK